MIKDINEYLSQFMAYDLARLITPIGLFLIIVATVLTVGLLLLKFKKIRKNTFLFYLFISPWWLGFLLFTLFPIGYSLIMSFSKWDMISPMKFIGFKNYIKAFSGQDKWFYQSLKVTIYYSFLSVPLHLVLGFLVALLMNQKIKGMRVFRTIFYMPSLVSGVALTALWMYIFNFQHGLLNIVLRTLGVEPQRWLSDPKWIIPSFVLMSLWGIGGGMVIYLAGLQDIPQSFYEAASIDGANAFIKLRKITIPMMTPIIFFNLIMGVIGSFQSFTQSFIMTKGGPNGASMFYVLNLYDQAFAKFNMGYASAQAWILFVIILIFTAFVFKSSTFWVYYGNEVRNKKVNTNKTADKKSQTTARREIRL